MSLPDAEILLAALVRQMRPQVGPDTAVAGVRTGGAWLAERLHGALGLHLPLGLLDPAYYRDDHGRGGPRRDVQPSRIAFAVDNADIILVDDILYTGRTVRAAMNEIFDYGRPARIRLAVLVDRGGRQLPVAPDFLGTHLEVPEEQSLDLCRLPSGALALQLVARS